MQVLTIVFSTEHRRKSNTYNSAINVCRFGIILLTTYLSYFSSAIEMCKFQSPKIQRSAADHITRLNLLIAEYSLSHTTLSQAVHE